MTLPNQRTASLCATALTLALSAPAQAQTIGNNQTFVGQVGDTNTLLIVQDGQDNRVGDTGVTGAALDFADTFLVTFGIALDDLTRFFVNQIGDGNDAEVNQTGFANAFGANRDIVDPNLNRAINPTGVNQMGDGNLLRVDQYAADASRTSGTGNIVVSVAQSGPDTSAAPTTVPNRLTIRQGLSEADAALDPVPSTAPGDGGHQVGVIVQRGDATATNTISIAQTGASFATDGTWTGSFIGEITQEGATTGTAGAGNAVTVTQTGPSNALSTARQGGTGNALTLTQIGSNNAVNDTDQTGINNTITVTMDGAGNGIAEVAQDNSASASGGNSATITITGQGNGFEPAGQPRVQSFSGRLDALTDPTRRTSVALASIEQLGGGHILDLRIVGDGNTFGFSQTGGDGNTIGAQQTGDDNELGVVQIGDGNTLDVVQDSETIGDGTVAASGGNALGATIRGDSNRASVLQRGLGNGIKLFVTGNSNNALGSAFDSALVAGLPALGSALLSGDLTPGRLVQRGKGNAITLTVTGDANLFAVLQEGLTNTAEGTVSGSGNQALVVQAGDGNIVDWSQTGTGNRTRILQ